MLNRFMVIIIGLIGEGRLLLSAEREGVLGSIQSTLAPGIRELQKCQGSGPSVT